MRTMSLFTTGGRLAQDETYGDDDPYDDDPYADDDWEDAPQPPALPPPEPSRPQPIARLVPRTAPLQLTHAAPPAETVEYGPVAWNPRLAESAEPQTVMTGGDLERVASAMAVGTDGVVPKRRRGCGRARGRAG